MYKLVFWVSDHTKFYDFIISELTVLISNAKLKKLSRKIVVSEYSYSKLELRSILHNIKSRSVLCKLIVEPYCIGENIEECINTMRNNDKYYYDLIQSEINNNNNKTFSWCCIIAGRKQTNIAKIQAMEALSFLFNDRNVVSIKNPGVQFVILQDYSKPNNSYCVIGKLLLAIQSKDRVSAKYKLSSRPILGPTSTNEELSFILANFANVKEYDLVLDPFCGTGSLLISPAHYNCITIGCDADKKVLRGWSIAYINPKYKQSYEKCKLYMNFKHYNLLEPDLAVNFVSSNIYRKNVINAIITDVPYGIRATITENTMETNTEKIGELLKSLFELAKHSLVAGGRLVFLMPHGNAINVPENYIHDLSKYDFSLAFNISTQILNTKYERCCYTFIKN